MKSKTKIATPSLPKPKFVPLGRNFFCDLSVGILSLLLSLPFLIPLHRMPIPSFYSEWTAFFLGSLVFLVMLFSLPNKLNQLQVPYVVAIPLASFLIVLLQACLGYFPYLSSALLILILLFWSASLMVIVSHCLCLISLEQLTKKLAWFIVIGGLINAVFGILQFLHLAPLLPDLISEAMPAANSGVYGNLAQQNHFATHLSLAMAALFYLYITGFLRWWQAPLMTSILLLGLFLSGSRSIFLYVLCGVFFTMLGRGSTSYFSLKRLRNLGLILVLTLFCMSLLIVSFDYKLPQLQRYLYFSETIGARFFLWRHAWAMFLNFPIFGVGWDAFAFQLVEQIGKSGQPNVWGVDQYAHNLLLQLLAGSGIVGLAAFLLPVGYFLHRQVQQKLNHERRFFCTSLCILLIHSMLEQPLYYTYFLAFASCFFACLETKFFSLTLSKWGAMLCVVGAISILLFCVKTLQDFRFIETHFYSHRAILQQVPVTKLKALHTWSVFPSTIESLRPDIFVSHQASPIEKLNLNLRLMHFSPMAETEFRHAALLAEAGKIDAAKLRFRTAALAYPSQTSMYLQRFKILAQMEPDKYAALATYAETMLINLANH